MRVRQEDLLPAWIVDDLERKRREREEDPRAPLHAPMPEMPEAPVETEKLPDRGVVIIPL